MFTVAAIVTVLCGRLNYCEPVAHCTATHSNLRASVLFLRRAALRIAETDIVFCSCGSFFLLMAALWNRTGHYIFALKFFYLSSSFFFSSPNLSRRRLDVCHTCTHGLSVNLGCRSETCFTRLAEIQDAKNLQKFAIWAPSHNFVGLYLRN